MGQLWVYINLTKKEKICAHSFGYGAKFCEQYGSDELGKAIMLLIASSKCNGSGGGDLPELNNLGRWSGDRIAFVGDYLEAEELEGYTGNSEDYLDISKDVIGLIINADKYISDTSC